MTPRARTRPATSPPRGSVLVITGMHRSGTSLVASVLREAGAHMGDRLLGPDRGNPRGHFEDVDFVEFHQRALFARGQHVRVAPGFAFSPSDEERREAAALVAARAGRPLWGWKDPRTALLLDFWNGLVPEAAYLFVYRHPLDVLLSLVRRADVHYLGLLEAVDAWYEYNRRVLAFRRRVPRTLLCHVQGVIGDGDAFGRLVKERLRVDLEVSSATVRALYRPDELQAPAGPGALGAAFARLCPEAMALLDALDADADLAAPRRAEPDAETPAVGGPNMGGTGAGAAPAARRAGLAAIVAEAVPDAYEALNAEWLAYADERERAVQWLRAQRQADLDEIARWSSANAALEAAVRDIEAGKAWLEQQRQAAEADTARWQAECGRLRDWHAAQQRDLEAGKAWLEQQRQAAEADTARWQAECERVRAWAASQAQAAAEAVQRWEQEARTLRAGVAELERGRAWLEERNAGLQAEVDRWAAEHARLREAHAQLESGVAWLEAQRTAQQAEIERWRAACADAEAWARDREETARHLARQLEGRIPS